MSAIETARRLLRSVPDGKLKSAARSVARRLGLSPYPASLLAELEKLEIESAGVESDGLPWVRLAGGPVFYGPTLLEGYADAEQYARLPAPLRTRFPLECYRVALEIVLRHVYPHATPDVTPPWPLEVRRRSWFPFHSDTLRDLGRPAAEVETLLQRFRLREGHVVIDAGACYGFGALRYSRQVGASGRVIALEADPEIQAVFQRNLDENGIRNVELVRSAVWNEVGELQFHLGSRHRQDSSLRDGVHPTEGAVTVPTVTVDALVERLGLERVDLLSLTVNTAEVEALEGATRTLERFAPNLSAAGWIPREGRKTHEFLTEMLRARGYEAAVGPQGRVIAWSPHGPKR